MPTLIKAPNYQELIGGPGPREVVDRGQRVVSWFSCGDASAVATHLTLQRFDKARVHIARIHIDNEHADNQRFQADCERWFDSPITEIRSDKFADAWDVWETERFLKGPYGAPCTRALKRNVREAYADFNDIQVFGFTAEEVKRADEFRWRNPEIMVVTPLIDAGLTKADCHRIVAEAGIEIPVMYRLGYANNNCIGCVKGGMGYWNKVRKDFPETFDRMAKLERTLDHAILKEQFEVNGKRVSRPIFLDELAPNRGRLASEPNIECSVFCAGLDGELEAA